MHTAENRPRADELFRSDHHGVLDRLEKLDRIFLRMEDDSASLEKADTAFFDEMIELFDTELVVHFRREEKVLFPTLEKYVPRDMSPIGLMLEEHERIFQAIDKFKEDQEAISAAGAPSDEVVKDMMFNARSLIELLRGHIDKEDNMLLPMMESHLTDHEWDMVWEGVEGIDLHTIERRE